MASLSHGRAETAATEGRPRPRAAKPAPPHPVFSWDGEKLLASASTRTVVRHQLVYAEGDRLSHLYLLRSGGLKLARQSTDGKELILSVVRPGTLFGAFSEPAEAPCSAQALERSAVTRIPLTALRRAVSHHPELAFYLMRSLDRHRRAAETTAYRLAFDPVAARLAGLLLELSDETTGELAVQLNQSELASAIGSSRETVCSILNQLRRKGLLDREGGRLRVVDRSLLEEVR